MAKAHDSARRQLSTYTTGWINIVEQFRTSCTSFSKSREFPQYGVSMYDTALWYIHHTHSSRTHQIKLKTIKSVLKDNLSLKMPGSLQRDISVLQVNSGTVTAALLVSTPTKSLPLKTFHSLFLQLSGRSTYAGIIKCLHENAGTRSIKQLHCSCLILL